MSQILNHIKEFFKSNWQRFSMSNALACNTLKSFIEHATCSVSYLSFSHGNSNINWQRFSMSNALAYYTLKSFIEHATSFESYQTVL
jgi:hypothetical protein